jgi:hypothetical protein
MAAWENINPLNDIDAACIAGLILAGATLTLTYRKARGKTKPPVFSDRHQAFFVRSQYGGNANGVPSPNGCVNITSSRYSS